MQRSSVAVIMKTPVHSQIPYISFLLKGSRTFQSRGSGIYRIMRSVLDDYEYGAEVDRLIFKVTHVIFVTTKARYLDMLSAQSSPGYGYICHNR